MGTQSPGTIQRTRSMLMNALLRLLERKRFLKITVNDICEEAMVSRSAFYVHFADKYELLSFSMEELLKRRKAEIGKLPLERHLLGLLEGIQENQQILYHLFQDNMSREMLEIFERMFETPVRERLEELQCMGVKLPGSIETVASFYAGGLANVILRWIREDFRTPREEMARCQCDLMSALL